MKRLRELLHHLFVPNEKNNFRAKLLHHDFLTSYLIIAFLLVFSFKNVGSGFRNVLGFATDITIEKLLQLTNQERTQYNLPALTYNDKLAQAAEEKAKDMFTKNYWTHYGPDGTTPWDFILKSGYQYEYAGENLAKNFLFSQGVVDAWMNSKTHKENIVRKEYTEVGFAVVNGMLNGEETTLVVQMFGKPFDNSLTIIRKELPGIAEAAQNEQPIVVNTQQVLAKQEQKPKVNLSVISFDIIYVFLFFLVSVLLVDLYYASKINIFRISGKNIAHIIFLVFVFLGFILFITKGTII